MAERKTKEQREQEAAEKAAAREIEGQVEETVDSAPRQQAAEQAAEESGNQRSLARRKYPRERLVLESYAFTGHPPHVMAGALAAQEDKDEFTVEQAKQAITRWLSPTEV